MLPLQRNFSLLPSHAILPLALSMLRSRCLCSWSLAPGQSWACCLTSFTRSVNCTFLQNDDFASSFPLKRSGRRLARCYVPWGFAGYAWNLALLNSSRIGAFKVRCPFESFITFPSLSRRLILPLDHRHSPRLHLDLYKLYRSPSSAKQVEQGQGRRFSRLRDEESVRWTTEQCAPLELTP